MTLSTVKTDKIFYLESVENVPAARINVHYHDWFEVYYLTAGKCNFFIDNKSYKLVQGDIVVIPRGVLHKTNYSSPTHSRIVINCPSELIPQSVMSHISNGIHIFRSSRMTGEIDGIFKNIKQEYGAVGEYTEEILRTSLSYLLIRIVRFSEECSEPDGEVTCVENAIAYIQNNYMNKICLSDTAKFCSVSCGHLSRSFKKQTGVGYNEYLSAYRLNMAEKLLVNQPGVSVSDIAYRCGFNDSNYFSSLFKKTYGVPPSVRRKGI